MKARLSKQRGRLGGDYYGIEVTLPDGEVFVLRMSDHDYSRVASRLTGLDEPKHVNPQMATMLGHIASKIQGPRT
jgi:hypothetical protein